MNNEDNIFNLDIYNSTNTSKLLKISYDNTKKHNVKIDCACPVGNTVNEFRVPYYNYEDQKLEKDLYKYCRCDASHSDDIVKNNYKYEGDAFLQDYYKEVFKDIDNVEKDKRLIFPS